MKILKSFLFFLIVLGLSFFLFWMVKMEQSDSVDPKDTIEYQRVIGQSTLKVPTEESIIDSNDVLKTFYADFEGQIVQKDKNVQLTILKNGNSIFEKFLSNVSIAQLISSDLNGNGFPEFWVKLKSGKKNQFYAFEYHKAQIKTLKFPQLMGRQSFGFAGNDTLYIEKSYLVRKFDFKNDTFSDLFNGKRACFYTFGLDDSFTLQRTLDYENE
ncbi:hypothetical protein V7S79_01915 [Aquirufa sp. ROCK-SH2]